MSFLLHKLSTWPDFGRVYRYAPVAMPIIRNRKNALFCPLTELGNFWHNDTSLGCFSKHWSYNFYLLSNSSKFAPKLGFINNCNAIHQGTPLHRAEWRSMALTGLSYLSVVCILRKILIKKNKINNASQHNVFGCSCQCFLRHNLKPEVWEIYERHKLAGILK